VPKVYFEMGVKQRVSYRWREWWIYGGRWSDKCRNIRVLDGRLVWVCQRERWGVDSSDMVKHNGKDNQLFIRWWCEDGWE